MTTQLIHIKPANFADKLFARQQFEFVVDAPPSECIKRLSQASVGYGSGPPKIKVVAMDEKESYFFEVEVKEDVRRSKFTRANCEGTIIQADTPAQSRISYEAKRSGLILLWNSSWIVLLVVSVAGIPDTNAKLLLACFAYIFFVMIGSDFSNDSKLGLRIYEALTSPTPPDAKPR